MGITLVEMTAVAPCGVGEKVTSSEGLAGKVAASKPSMKV